MHLYTGFPDSSPGGSTAVATTDPSPHWSRHRAQRSKAAAQQRSMGGADFKGSRVGRARRLGKQRQAGESRLSTLVRFACVCSRLVEWGVPMREAVFLIDLQCFLNRPRHEERGGEENEQPGMHILKICRYIIGLALASVSSCLEECILLLAVPPLRDWLKKKKNFLFLGVMECREGGMYWQWFLWSLSKETEKENVIKKVGMYIVVCGWSEPAICQSTWSATPTQGRASRKLKKGQSCIPCNEGQLERGLFVYLFRFPICLNYHYYGYYAKPASTLLGCNIMN